MPAPVLRPTDIEGPRPPLGCSPCKATGFHWHSERLGVLVELRGLQGERRGTQLGPAWSTQGEVGMGRDMGQTDGCEEKKSHMTLMVRMARNSLHWPASPASHCLPRLCVSLLAFSHTCPCQPQGLCTGRCFYLEEPLSVFQRVDSFLILQGPLVPSRKLPPCSFFSPGSLSSSFGNL